MRLEVPRSRRRSGRRDEVARRRPADAQLGVDQCDDGAQAIPPRRPQPPRAIALRQPNVERRAVPRGSVPGGEGNKATCRPAVRRPPDAAGAGSGSCPARLRSVSPGPTGPLGDLSRLGRRVEAERGYGQPCHFGEHGGRGRGRAHARRREVHRLAEIGEGRAGGTSHLLASGAPQPRGSPLSEPPVDDVHAGGRSSRAQVGQPGRGILISRGSAPYAGSTTTSPATRSGWRRAVSTATWPPIECPTRHVGPSRSCASTSSARAATDIWPNATMPTSTRPCWASVARDQRNSPLHGLAAVHSETSSAQPGSARPQSPPAANDETCSSTTGASRAVTSAHARRTGTSACSSYAGA
jgi:hypothetical protein